MARAIALSLVMMATLGCTDGDAPPVLVQDLGVALDGAAADMTGVGAACITACECTPGLACRMMKCEAASVPVFCCGTASCTDGNLCEFPNGTVSQCDRSDGGGTPVDVDAGATPSACEMTLCTAGAGGNAFCKLACGALSATCVKSGGIDHCMP
ncbi:MAG TPA: hypothetical protein VHB97_23835 [Polyangia bacterium]|nr:hypothetical protein [Polyangia bacterium]